MSALIPALVALTVSFLVGFGVTPLTARVAHRFGILDRPAEAGHKRHLVATPYLGGIAIFVGLVAGAMGLAAAGEGFFSPDVPRKILAVIAIAIALGLVGLLDDIRPLPRIVRLAAQLAAAVGVWALGFRVLLTAPTALNLVLTVLWIVGITNAFNLLDNMDGLSAGLAGVGAFSFTLLGLVNGLYVLPIASAALAGAAFGFLAHNRPPAKIFMGDAGSLFLGFMLAVLGIALRFDNLPQVTFLVPVIVLGLPIFDTTLVVLSRLRHGRPVFTGGHDHLSHRLVRIGLPVPTAVGLLYWSGLCLGWIGLVISRSNTEVAWMLLGFVIALGLFFGTLLWRVPVYEEEGATEPLPADAVDPDEVVRALKRSI